MDDYAKLKNKLQLGKSSNIKYIDEKDMDNICLLYTSSKKKKLYANRIWKITKYKSNCRWN